MCGMAFTIWESCGSRRALMHLRVGSFRVGKGYGLPPPRGPEPSVLGRILLGGGNGGRAGRRRSMTGVTLEWKAYSYAMPLFWSFCGV